MLTHSSHFRKNMASLLIQIQRWLKQSKVWRFVGFASAVVGLLCYALSTSFNYLFGEWNLLKTFLYTVFSFIICVAVLFAKVLQPSASLRLKAHMAFLVLTITAVYSYFFDKVVNGKPDAYSLISCGAFAMMSLSLSRHTHCGFEVDLLYFFLGALIVQLMKIKCLLGLVGVGFSYSLVILRSCLDSHLEAAGSNGFQDQPDVVIQVGSLQLQSHANSATALPITPQEGDIHDQAITQVNSHSQEASTDIPLIMLLASMEAIEKKNHNLLSTLSNHLDSFFSRPDLSLLIDALSSEIINNLNEAVKLGIAAGFEKECCHMYITCRREFLEESLSRMGLQKRSIEEVHEMPWKELEDEMKRWIKASNVSFKILFPSERRICDRIFFGFSSAADLSFMEACRGSAIQLLNFADAVAIGSRSPERLFRILDVFETLRDLIPEFEVLFSDQYSVSLRNEAITIWKRLGEAIRGIFKELENLISCHSTKVAFTGGFHPITRYVMNYLRAACRSRQTLEQVFEDYGHPLKDYPKLDDRIASNSSLSVQMDWIMELLESNLEAKSKIHKDPALCYVFLMNNGMYIVQKAKDSELGTILGDDCIRKHTAKVREYHLHYQSSWNKVLGILKLDSNGSVGPNGVAKSMKDKLKLFNAQFEDICRAQSSWFVFDEQLREEIRISLEKILLPAYGNFIARFQNVQELGKNADRYIKYGVEDIEARLNDLFQGSRG